jgi:hypothetical protein
MLLCSQITQVVHRSVGGNARRRSATESALRSASRPSARHAAQDSTLQLAEWSVTHLTVLYCVRRLVAARQIAPCAPPPARSLCARCSATQPSSRAATSAPSLIASGSATSPRSVQHRNAPWSAKVQRTAGVPRIRRCRH